MKRRRAGALALLVLLLLPLCGCAPQADTREIFAMDTVMELTVYGSGAADRTRETAELLSGLEAKLSVTRADSEVARLNAGKTSLRRRRSCCAGASASGTRPVERWSRSSTR